MKLPSLQQTCWQSPLGPFSEEKYMKENTHLFTVCGSSQVAGAE